MRPYARQCGRSHWSCHPCARLYNMCGAKSNAVLQRVRVRPRRVGRRVLGLRRLLALGAGSRNGGRELPLRVVRLVHASVGSTTSVSTSLMYELGMRAAGDSVRGRTRVGVVGRRVRGPPFPGRVPVRVAHRELR